MNERALDVLLINPASSATAWALLRLVCSFQ